MAAATVAPPYWTTCAAEIVIPVPRRDLREETLDAEAILIGPGVNMRYRLNETALFIWRRCDGRTTTRQIAAQLVETFDADFDRALDHVEQVVAVFAAAGLFEPPNPA
jgi:hypothetical protein